MTIELALSGLSYCAFTVVITIFIIALAVLLSTAIIQGAMNVGEWILNNFTR